MVLPALLDLFTNLTTGLVKLELTSGNEAGRNLLRLWLVPMMKLGGELLLKHPKSQVTNRLEAILTSLVDPSGRDLLDVFLSSDKSDKQSRLELGGFVAGLGRGLSQDQHTALIS